MAMAGRASAGGATAGDVGRWHRRATSVSNAVRASLYRLLAELTKRLHREPEPEKGRVKTAMDDATEPEAAVRTR